MDASTVKLKFSSKINKKAPIFVADFSCGQLNDNDMKFSCFISKTDSQGENRSAKRLLVANGKHLTHIGSSWENNDIAPIRYFVGVRNKNSGKMKLYDSTTFHLKPVFPNVPSVPETVDLTQKDYWEERQKLTAEFGSKSSMRTLKIQKKLTVEEKDISLEDALQESSINALLALSDQSSQAVTYLPNINRDAATVDEVFDMNDIISLEEESQLQNQADDFLNSYATDPTAAKSNLCSFVSLIIDDVKSDSLKLKYVLYYNYMITFQHLPIAEIRKKNSSSQIPSFFFDRLLEKFTIFSKYASGKSFRVMPSQSKDKLLAYILILGLYINNFIVNINQVLADLKKVSAKHFILLAQTLGCHIANEKKDGQAVKLAELRLPLYSAPLKFKKH